MLFKSFIHKTGSRRSISFCFLNFNSKFLLKLSIVWIAIYINSRSTKSRVDATRCPSCWTQKSGSRSCKPAESKIGIHCTDENMIVEADRCLFGHQERLFHLNKGLCPYDYEKSSRKQKSRKLYDFDNDSNRYKVQFSLDSCGTNRKIVNNELVFENKLTASSEEDDPFAIISTATSSYIDVKCSYPISYTTELLPPGEASAQEEEDDNENRFTFGIKLYTNHLFNDHNSNTKLTAGDTAFFKVESKNLPSHVGFAVTECSLRTSSDTYYKIYIDNCSNGAVNMVKHGYNKFSFKMFTFRRASSNTLKLACKVNLCLDADGTDNSVCDSKTRNVCNGNEKWFH